MIDAGFVQLMARYNAWQNDSLVTAASTLSDAARREDRGAFFKSIHGTLNHVLWADQLWFSRLGDGPAPTVNSIGESQAAIDDWDALVGARAEMDTALLDWSARLTPDVVTGDLSWLSGAVGRTVTKPRSVLIVHMFNHGTHHRGQIHAMLTAAGAVPDDTDLPFLPARFEER